MPIRTLSDVFADLRSKKRIGLMPFVPAGFPDLQTTAAVLPALESAGAGAIEIGFPFSDPVADGPTIQEAFNHALTQKLRVADVFATISTARRNISLPLVAMVSYSIVYRFGQHRFIDQAKAAGFNGLILPDVPPPEAEAVCAAVRAGGLDTILLVSPTTSPRRRAEIARLCSGFVYYLSVTGITGARDSLPPDIEHNVRELRTVTSLPVCVGFGVSKPQHIHDLAAFADGAIVGSALVRVMKEHQQAGPDAICDAIRRYCKQLLA